MNVGVVGPASVPQSQPRNYQWSGVVLPIATPYPPDDCDPRRPQTPHPGGIQTLFADGSVKSIATTVNPNTWWAIVTPLAGDIPGDY